MAKYDIKIIKKFKTYHSDIITMKIKSHIELKANEEADRLANLATETNHPPSKLKNSPYFSNLKLDCHYSQCDNNNLKYIISRNSIF